MAGEKQVGETQDKKAMTKDQLAADTTEALKTIPGHDEVFRTFNAALNTATEKANETMSGAAIAGIVIGTLVGMLSIVGLGVFIYKYKNNNTHAMKSDGNP